eukprot:3949671-Pleurochrysis_carterae.AAC.3
MTVEQRLAAASGATPELEHARTSLARRVSISSGSWAMPHPAGICACEVWPPPLDPSAPFEMRTRLSAPAALGSAPCKQPATELNHSSPF